MTSDDQFAQCIYNQDWDSARQMIENSVVSDDLVEWSIDMACAHGQADLLRAALGHHRPSSAIIDVALEKCVHHQEDQCLVLLLPLLSSFHERHKPIVHHVVETGQSTMLDHMWSLIPVSWHGPLLVRAAAHQKAALLPRLLQEKEIAHTTDALITAMREGHLPDIDAIHPLVYPKSLHVCFVHRPFEENIIPSQEVLQHVWALCSERPFIEQNLYSMTSMGYLPFPAMPEVIARQRALDEQKMLHDSIASDAAAAPPRKM